MKRVMSYSYHLNEVSKIIFKIVKNPQYGFTLVELMIVIAIISLMAAVGVPQFKKYQAKSKTAEAILQLSSIYTAEQSFFADYNMYHTCLSYMGFNPSSERANRYYTTGYSQGTQLSVIAIAYAVNSGLNTSLAPLGCPMGYGPDHSYFLAGKGIGNSISSELDLYVACPGNVGDQGSEATMFFVAAAAGVISANHPYVYGGNRKSCYTIDQNKKILNIHPGY